MLAGRGEHGQPAAGHIGATAVVQAFASMSETYAMSFLVAVALAALLLWKACRRVWPRDSLIPKSKQEV